MTAPARSRAGKNRTWWPVSDGLAATGLFSTSSDHSPSIQNWNAPAGLDVLVYGLNVPIACPFVVEWGRNDWPSSPPWANSDPATPAVPGVPLLVYQRTVAVFPWLWKAASCWTVTGRLLSARSQYRLRTSSPAAAFWPFKLPTPNCWPA